MHHRRTTVVPIKTQWRGLRTKPYLQKAQGAAFTKSTRRRINCGARKRNSLPRAKAHSAVKVKLFEPAQVFHRAAPICSTGKNAVFNALPRRELCLLRIHHNMSLHSRQAPLQCHEPDLSRVGIFYHVADKHNVSALAASWYYKHIPDLHIINIDRLQIELIH